MINDPYLTGKLAATNASSDVIMVEKLFLLLNIVAFPENMDLEILHQILKVGQKSARSWRKFLLRALCCYDDTSKYGLSVTGIVCPDKILQNNNFVKKGDLLIVTKPNFE